MATLVEYKNVPHKAHSMFQTAAENYYRQDYLDTIDNDLSRFDHDEFESFLTDKFLDDRSERVYLLHSRKLSDRDFDQFSSGDVDFFIEHEENGTFYYILQYHL